jgi:hypothetical protein
MLFSWIHGQIELNGRRQPHGDGAHGGACAAGFFGGWDAPHEESFSLS